MNSKLLGGIMLMVGTSIGAGMLALPIATTESGFLPGITSLLIVWAVMTLGAFLILEVNLWFPAGTNLGHMARYTLGRFGEIVLWLTYCILLYSLMVAYISGGRDIIHALILQLTPIDFPLWFDALSFTMIIAAIIFCGIRVTDLTNRGLMIIKFITFIALVSIVMPHIELHQLVDHDIGKMMSGVTIMFTSFGFAIIVPSLREYLDNDVSLLRRVIFIGSLIPLAAYLLWIVLIMGTIPRVGEYSLFEIMKADTEVTGIAQALEHYLSNTWMAATAKIFSSICLVTSLLGVSLSVKDFWTDSLNSSNEDGSQLLMVLITFIPPLLILFVYPKLFLVGLKYAGICCVLLLCVLPVLMAWRGRYHCKLATGYQVCGGRWLLLLGLAASVYFLGIGIIYDIF